ncbi:glycoside hydrolase family 43 protein [Luteolibacter soli]
MLAPLASAQEKEKKPGNPIDPGWYADPEGIVFGNEYWVFPTYSAPYDQQTHFDAFSSPDLKKWTKHEKIFDTGDIKWAKRAMWAPSIIEKGGKYYLFFAANDIQNDQQEGGIGVAVANKPQGPYKDLLGKPLIDKFHNGAQPIDGFVFHDDDGSYYFIYGGWRHCNITKLKDDFTGFIPFEGGETFKEITPKGYVEGPFVFKKDGKYYFMWSEGGWTGPDYKVAYAISDSLIGPHERIGVVLQQDPAVGTGAGHHSVIHNKKDDSWYIVYHRHPLGDKDGNHRVTCVDKLEFDEKGLIKPVKMTFEGVAASPLK